MINSHLHIHDDEPSTLGGPPAWLAFTIIFFVFLFAAIALAVIGTLGWLG